MSLKSLLVSFTDEQLGMDASIRPFNFELVIPEEFKTYLTSDVDTVYLGLHRFEKFAVGAALRNISISELDEQLVVSGDPSFSEIFSAESANWISATGLSRLAGLGVVSLWDFPGEQETVFQELAMSKWKVAFGAVPRDVTNKALDYSPHSANTRDEILASIEIGLRRNFCSDELHIAPELRGRADPFKSVAQILTGSFIDNGIVNLEPNTGQMSHVNIDLRPISDADLRVRVRKNRSVPTISDLENIEIKIERAERRHQEILEDCSLELAQRKISALNSDSVDLAFKIGSDLTLIEIKSATKENFTSQFDKGLIQIARYRWEFSAHHYPIRACLLIEKPIGLDISEDFANFAETLAIDVLFWDSTKHWPERVTNLVLSNYSYLES